MGDQRFVEIWNSFGRRAVLRCRLKKPMHRTRPTPRRGRAQPRQPWIIQGPGGSTTAAQVAVKAGKLSSALYKRLDVAW